MAKRVLCILLAAFAGAYGYEQYLSYEEKKYEERLQSSSFHRQFYEEIRRAKRHERNPQKNELSLAVLIDKEVKGEWERKWVTKNWEDHLFAAIEDATQEFRKEFGIGFSPTLVDSWDSPDGRTNKNFLLLYGTLHAKPTDLVLLCTGQDIDGGIGELEGKYALVNATYSARAQRLVIQHEISHLLGADHVPDAYLFRFYLMHPQMTWMSTRTWDGDSKKRIRKNIKLRFREKNNAQISS